MDSRILFSFHGLKFVPFTIYCDVHVVPDLTPGTLHAVSSVFSHVAFILRELPYLLAQPDAPGSSYTSSPFHTPAQVPFSGTTTTTTKKSKTN